MGSHDMSGTPRFPIGRSPSWVGIRERGTLRLIHPSCGSPISSKTLELGGLEKLLVNFVRNADRSRFALRVVTLGTRGRLASEVEALGSTVDALNTPSGLIARARSIISLARKFRRDRIDVVHTHSEGPLLYGSTAARLAGVKRVIHTRHHGPDLGNSRRAITAMAFATRWVDRVACVSDAGARRACSRELRRRRSSPSGTGSTLIASPIVDPTHRVPP